VRGDSEPRACPHLLGHPGEGEPLAAGSHGVVSVGMEALVEPGLLPVRDWQLLQEEEEEEEEGT